MDLKSRRVLRFDSLEERVYLSVSGHSISAARGAHVSTHSMPLTGTIQVAPTTTGASAVATQGTGNVHPLGPVTVVGTLTSTSNSGGGDLTLSGQGGSVSLVFNSTHKAGRLGLPTFHFTVVGGSSAYANASGHGTMSWVIGNQPTIEFKIHGTFRA